MNAGWPWISMRVDLVRLTGAFEMSRVIYVIQTTLVIPKWSPPLK